MTENGAMFKTELYGMNQNGECFARLELPQTHTVVEGLKVMRGTGGGVQVYLP